jgi:hypothetical protein
MAKAEVELGICFLCMLFSTKVCPLNSFKQPSNTSPLSLQEYPHAYNLLNFL